MSGHLKRLAAPKTWKINRKENIFTTKPKPGAHSRQMAMPLGLVLRDMLCCAETAAEVNRLLQNKEVQVDGIQRKDFRFAVGLFDVISLKDINKHYRIILSVKGQFELREISPAEAVLKLGKVTGKTVLPEGKMQYHLHDGKNIISQKTAKVGDTLVLSLPSLEVKEVLPLKLGMMIFLVRGKHCGDVGTLKEVAGKEATYLLDQQEIGTARRYLLVVGEKKSLITLA